MRGIKYLLIISALLLALAFVLTTFVFKGNDEEEAATETTTEIIVLEEPVEEEEDENIDNKWAMFLVNKNNPLPMDYDSRIETKMVFESWREYFIDSRAAPYFEDMARAVKAAVSVPVLLTGGIIDGETAERLLRENACDLVGIGRALLRDPDWAENQVYKC